MIQHDFQNLVFKLMTGSLRLVKHESKVVVKLGVT